MLINSTSEYKNFIHSTLTRSGKISSQTALNILFLINNANILDIAIYVIDEVAIGYVIFHNDCLIFAYVKEAYRRMGVYKKITESLKFNSYCIKASGSSYLKLKQDSNYLFNLIMENYVY